MATGFLAMAGRETRRMPSSGSSGPAGAELVGRGSTVTGAAALPPERRLPERVLEAEDKVAIVVRCSSHGGSLSRRKALALSRRFADAQVKAEDWDR